MNRSWATGLAVFVAVCAVAALAVPATAAVVSVDVTTTPDPAPPGSNVTVTTTVEHHGPEDSSVNVQRVELATAPEGGETVERRVPARRIQTGEQVALNLSEEFDRAGEYQRYVRVRVRETPSRVTTVVRPVNVTVAQTHPATSLSASPLDANGETNLALTVANGLPNEVRGVQVDLESDDLTIQQRSHVVSGVPSGDEATVRTVASADEGGEATVDATLTYVTADGESRSVTRTLSTTLDERGSAATIELTGVRYDRQGDELVVSGSASNLGTSNVSSVLVGVGDGDGGNGTAGPAQTEATYFVGTVPANDYKPFTVRAALPDDPAGTLEVPIEIGYDRRGDRLTRTVTRTYSPGTEVGETQSAGPLPAVGVALVLVLGGVLAYRRFR